MAIDRLVLPQLKRLRADYTELANKRVEVKETLGLFQTIRELESRGATIDTGSDADLSSPLSDGDLPTIAADAFAQQVETLLKAWHFPEPERVYFDSKKQRPRHCGQRAHSARKKVACDHARCFHHWSA
jgi:hypothetical protein